MSLYKLMIICCNKGILFLAGIIRFARRHEGICVDESEDCFDSLQECTIEFSSFDFMLDDMARKVDALMDRERLFLMDDITLDKLAKEIGTNRTYLSKMFNRTKRCSFSS